MELAQGLAVHGYVGFETDGAKAFRDPMQGIPTREVSGNRMASVGGDLAWNDRDGPGVGALDRI